MMTTATIGLIGAGRMGLAQIKHLIRGGYQVAVCERDETNQTKAMALGAYLVDTLKPVLMRPRSSMWRLASIQRLRQCVAVHMA